MRQRHAGAAIAAALSFCSLVTLHGDLLPADVPFDLVEQHLIVAKGSIAGLRGLNLLIDTGTTPSVVDKRVAKRLKLKGEPSLLIAFGQSIKFESAALSGLRIGPFEPGDVPAGIGDLCTSSRRGSTPSSDSTCSRGRASGSITRRTHCRSDRRSVNRSRPRSRLSGRF